MFPPHVLHLTNVEALFVVGLVRNMGNCLVEAVVEAENAGSVGVLFKKIK